MILPCINIHKVLWEVLKNGMVFFRFTTLPFGMCEYLWMKNNVCSLSQRILIFDKLTHISLASFLWDIGKQNSPRCDAAKHGVPSGAILFAYMKFIQK